MVAEVDKPILNPRLNWWEWFLDRPPRCLYCGGPVTHLKFWGTNALHCICYEMNQDRLPELYWKRVREWEASKDYQVVQNIIKGEHHDNRSTRPNPPRQTAV